MSLPLIRPPGTGQWLAGVAGVRYLVRLSGEETSGELAVVECVLAPGALGAAPHVHREHAEHFQVVTGSVTFALGPQEIEAGPDTWVSVPRRTAHGFRNAGSVDALLRCVVTPAGYENYFRAIDAALADGTELDSTALSAMRANYATDTLDL